MVAAGYARRPGLGMTLSAGLEIASVEFIKARVAQPQFPGGFTGGKLLAAMTGQKMTDKRGRQTFDQ